MNALANQQCFASIHCKLGLRATRFVGVVKRKLDGQNPLVLLQLTPGKLRYYVYENTGIVLFQNKMGK